MIRSIQHHSTALRKKERARLTFYFPSILFSITAYKAIPMKSILTLSLATLLFSSCIDSTMQGGVFNESTTTGAPIKEQQQYSEIALNAVAFASQEPAFTAEKLGVSNKYTFGQVVMEAIKGSPEAIEEVLIVSEHTSGAGSELISTALLAILESTGDKKFSELVKTRSKDGRNTILFLIDFALQDYDQSWLEYPKTKSLRTS